MSIHQCHEAGCPETVVSVSDFMKLCDYHYNQFMTPEEVLKDQKYKKCSVCKTRKTVLWIDTHWAYGDLFAVDDWVGLCKDHGGCDMGHPNPSFGKCSGVTVQLLTGFWRLNKEFQKLKFCESHLLTFTELIALHPNSDRCTIAHKMLTDGNVRGVHLAPLEGPYI